MTLLSHLASAHSQVPVEKHHSTLGNPSEDLVNTEQARSLVDASVPESWLHIRLTIQTSSPSSEVQSSALQSWKSFQCTSCSIQQVPKSFESLPHSWVLPTQLLQSLCLD